MSFYDRVVGQFFTVRGHQRLFCFLHILGVSFGQELPNSGLSARYPETGEVACSACNLPIIIKALLQSAGAMNVPGANRCLTGPRLRGGDESSDRARKNPQRRI